MPSLFKLIRDWLLSKNAVVAAFALIGIYQYISKRVAVQNRNKITLLLENERRITQTLQTKRDLETKGRLAAEAQLHALLEGEDLKVSADLAKLTGHGMMKPVGTLKSVFKERNGTPRQGAITVDSRASLRIEITGIEGSHALEGLSEFSHVWLVYVFHKNTNGIMSSAVVNGVYENNKLFIVSRSLKESAASVRAKVKPPRLGGKSVGLFSTRTPHRPNPIGLSCVRLDHIEGDVLHFRGIDLLDGTPILDIKPYIPSYDSVVSPRIAQWLTNSESTMEVRWNESACDELKSHLKNLEFYDESEYDTVKSAIDQVLCHDIRTIHKKKQHGVKERGSYGFCFDRLNICFDYVSENEELELVEVTQVEFWPEGPEIQKSKKFHQEHDDRMQIDGESSTPKLKEKSKKEKGKKLKKKEKKGKKKEHDKSKEIEECI